MTLTTAAPQRTHQASTLERGETALVERIEQRLANLTQTTPAHGEPFEILHYRAGHDDYFRQVCLYACARARVCVRAYVCVCMCM